MKIKTKSGFKCDIDERVLDDYRLLKAIAQADDTSNPGEMIQGLVKIVSMIFGDQEGALMEHLASKNSGMVPQEALRDDLTSVFKQVKELKNSQSSQA